MSDVEHREESPAGLPVLVGVDGSPDGRRAALFAMREARVRQASLLVVNVIDTRAAVHDLWGIVANAGLRQASEDIVNDTLRRLAGQGFPADLMTGKSPIGRPGEVLAALSQQAQLLVVGRRSIPGLERMFVGSTSLDVATRASCPVVIISGASTPHETGQRHTVAVGIGPDLPRHTALRSAFREASLRQSALQIHVVIPTGHDASAAARADALARLEQELASLRAEHPAVDAQTQMAAGNLAEELINASTAVDLLIIGLPAHQATLRGAIRAIMAHAHSPVLLIHETTPPDRSESL